MLFIDCDDGHHLPVYQNLPVHQNLPGQPDGKHAPAIVFLHGWTANHLEWSPFVRRLQKRFRLYRWDARGHSDTHEPPSPPTLARMARDLEQMLSALDLSDITLVGHSMGALTAWQYLRDFGSGRLARLCLIDQSPRLLNAPDWPFPLYGNFDAAANAGFLAELAADLPEAVLRLVANGLNDAARNAYATQPEEFERQRELLRRLPVAAHLACWQSIASADFRTDLAGIDCPTLLIYGGRSNFYPPETGAWLARQIPGATLSCYPEEDHSPHLWQRQRFLNELEAFCLDSPPGSQAQAG